jgi:hypothetical protein
MSKTWNAEFLIWYEQYPRHVGKLAAERAFLKARRIADLEELIDGIARYRKTKPSYADWAHPATWLNQGRWMDEPDGKAPAAADNLVDVPEDVYFQYLKDSGREGHIAVAQTYPSIRRAVPAEYLEERADNVVVLRS